MDELEVLFPIKNKAPMISLSLSLSIILSRSPLAILCLLLLLLLLCVVVNRIFGGGGGGDDVNDLMVSFRSYPGTDCN